MCSSQYCHGLPESSFVSKNEIIGAPPLINAHTHAQELVSCGAVVVAESAPNRDEYPELERVVRYFDEDSADAMLRAIDGALSGVISAHKNLAPGEAAAKNLDATNLDATGAPHAALTAAAIAASQRRFAFLFERFLVGVGFVPLTNATALDAPLYLPALVTIRHAEGIVWDHSQE
jgi:hypothetical protein